MVRPGKKVWKLFKKHQPLDGATPFGDAANIDLPAGKSAAHEREREHEHEQDNQAYGCKKGKTGRSWFGLKANKKQNKKSQSHDDTFQTAETDEGANDHEAVVGQLDLFPGLQNSVPTELEVGLRPASGDESSRAELEIWQAFVKDGADLDTEGVEASVVPRSDAYEVVDDPFSSIRVTPFGKHETKKSSTYTASLVQTMPDFPSVEPFPAFEEATQIPEFWRDDQETTIGATQNYFPVAPQHTAKHFFVEDENSLFGSHSTTTRSIKETEILRKKSRSTLDDNSRFADADTENSIAEEEEVPLEPSIEAHIEMPATPANVAFPVDSEVTIEFPVSFPDVDTPELSEASPGESHLVWAQAPTADQTSSGEPLPISKATAAISIFLDEEIADTVSDDVGGTGQTMQNLAPVCSKPVEEICTVENGNTSIFHRQTAEDSNPVLSPSLVSRRRTGSAGPDFDAPGLYTGSLESCDNSVSSDSVSIKWNPSDLESKEHDSRAPTASSLIPSFASQVASPSPERRCETASTMNDQSSLHSAAASGVTESPLDEAGFEGVYHDYDDEISLSQSEAKQQQLGKDDGLTNDECSRSSAVQDCDQREADLPDENGEVGSCRSETDRMNELGTIAMNEDDKLALVKRVSSVGHLSGKLHFAGVQNLQTTVILTCWFL